MCNVDRNTSVSDTVIAKHVLPTKSFHKRTVGQGNTNTCGQVFPVYSRFMVLNTDSRTQDKDSTMDDHCGDSSQNSQVSMQIHQLLDMDIVNSAKASTSRYFHHSSCYSSHNIMQESREQLGSKSGFLPLSPIFLYNGNPSHRSSITDVLQGP